MRGFQGKRLQFISSAFKKMANNQINHLILLEYKIQNLNHIFRKLEIRDSRTASALKRNIARRSTVDQSQWWANEQSRDLHQIITIHWLWTIFSSLLSTNWYTNVTYQEKLYFIAEERYLYSWKKVTFRCFKIKSKVKYSKWMNNAAV